LVVEKSVHQSLKGNTRGFKLSPMPEVVQTAIGKGKREKGSRGAQEAGQIKLDLQRKLFQWIE
jgi:hypothetical protein